MCITIIVKQELGDTKKKQHITNWQWKKQEDLSNRMEILISRISYQLRGLTITSIFFNWNNNKESSQWEKLET